MDKLQALHNEWQVLQPLSERKQHLLNKRFIVEYNYNSNHIEGNTLTYGQTEILLLFGKVSGEGNLKDFVDMKASLASVRMLENEIEERTALTQTFIRQLHQVLLREDYILHRALSDGSQTSYTIHAGRYKTRPNSVIARDGERFDYASPEETAALMGDLVDWYNEAEAQGKMSPVELAALLHYRFIRIHPFEDGNGRMARLMVNYVLARHGWPMVVVRNRNKDEYLEALHETDVEIGPSTSAGAHAQLGQIGPFLKYFKALVREELQYNIGFAKEQSPNVWWYDGQKIAFRSPSSNALLTMMQQTPGTTIGEMAETTGISPSAVKKQLRQMIKKGYVERRGKDGDWKVFASASV